MPLPVGALPDAMGRGGTPNSRSIRFGTRGTLSTLDGPPRNDPAWLPQKRYRRGKLTSAIAGEPADMFTSPERAAAPRNFWASLPAALATVADRRALEGAREAVALALAQLTLAIIQPISGTGRCRGDPRRLAQGSGAAPRRPGLAPRPLPPSPAPAPDAAPPARPCQALPGRRRRRGGRAPRALGRAGGGGRARAATSGRVGSLVSLAERGTTGRVSTAAHQRPVGPFELRQAIETSRDGDLVDTRRKKGVFSCRGAPGARPQCPCAGSQRRRASGPWRPPPPQDPWPGIRRPG